MWALFSVKKLIENLRKTGFRVLSILYKNKRLRFKEIEEYAELSYLATYRTVSQLFLYGLVCIFSEGREVELTDAGRRVFEYLLDAGYILHIFGGSF